MKKIAATLALGIATAGAALAAGTLADIDADGNGALSLAELQAAYTLDEAGFAALDANGDGALDQAEFDAAVSAGTLVAKG